MEYSVRARPRLVELRTFWKALNDNSIRSQEPDGREIVASMKRAVIDGYIVKWYETCYCYPPLNHERSTVYDQFFTDMMIESVTNPPKLEGERFWDYLREYWKLENGAEKTSHASPKFRYVPIRAV